MTSSNVCQNRQYSNQTQISTIFLSFLAVFLEIAGPPRSPQHPFSGGMFLHSSHLQFQPHFRPAWQHSQYFFKQLDFLQLQPFTCLWSSIFWPKGSGLRSIRAKIALLRSSLQISKLWHPTQLQPSQVWFNLKQSQQSLRHLVFLQLQKTFFPELGSLDTVFIRDLDTRLPLLSLSLSPERPLGSYSLRFSLIQEGSESFSSDSQGSLLRLRSSESPSELSIELELLLASSSEDSKMILLTMPYSSSWIGMNLDGSLTTGVSTYLSSVEQLLNWAEGSIRVCSTLGGKGKGDRARQKLLWTRACRFTGVYGTGRLQFFSGRGSEG